MMFEAQLLFATVSDAITRIVRYPERFKVKGHHVHLHISLPTSIYPGGMEGLVDLGIWLATECGRPTHMA